jgi:hypothetical protein
LLFILQFKANEIGTTARPLISAAYVLILCRSRHTYTARNHGKTSR